MSRLVERHQTVRWAHLIKLRKIWKAQNDWSFLNSLHLKVILSTISFSAFEYLKTLKVLFFSNTMLILDVNFWAKNPHTVFNAWYLFTIWSICNSNLYSIALSIPASQCSKYRSTERWLMLKMRLALCYSKYYLRLILTIWSFESQYTFSLLL